ncbi:hypothetical protein FGIG_04827 [Fasciola gigantica]|uniref:Uncharacterized protein n=1 Tax=Fasciola gigantica TaxID=46835 RepID=A0A504Z2K9_FASGI|nr:hypothetical protein FGIG_04827 [Fasciola gigantica]
MVTANALISAYNRPIGIETDDYEQKLGSHFFTSVSLPGKYVTPFEKRITTSRFHFLPPGSVVVRTVHSHQIQRCLQRLRVRYPLLPRRTVEQSDEQENDTSAMMAAGCMLTPNLIPTGNEVKGTSTTDYFSTARSSNRQIDVQMVEQSP